MARLVWCNGQPLVSRYIEGRELNYVHAANLADGTAQLFMSRGT